MLGKLSFIKLKLFIVIIIFMIVTIFYIKTFYINTFSQNPLEISFLQIRREQCSYVYHKNGISLSNYKIIFQVRYLY